MWVFMTGKWAYETHYHHVVAMSLSTTWHLVLVLEKGGGGVVSAHGGNHGLLVWVLIRWKWASK